MKNKRNPFKRFCCRLTAAVLALSMLVPMSAFAAESQNDGTVPVTYDESLYVTMDYYGNPKNTSIVKGVDLNGNKTFTDYGVYKKVQNMSGYDKPSISADHITWDLKDYDKSRMYFECTPEDGAPVALPWNFKVSYKLNGVPTKAEELAGASGLVEIVAECEANDGVNDYLKNNVLLELVTLVDTESILSVEAEGAQTQALGKYKAIIFAALPGESITFKIRIGSDSFSSLGLIMMMEPATLSQLEQLKELRAAKDTIGDAPAVLLDGMSSMLRGVTGVTDGLSGAAEGIDSFKKAYANVKDYSGDIIASSAQTVESLSELSRNLSAMMPYIDSTSRQLETLKKVLDELKNKLNGDPAQATGEQLAVALADSGADLQAARASLSDMESEAGKLVSLAQTLRTNLEKAALPAADDSGLGGVLEDLQKAIQNLNTVLELIAQQKEAIEKILGTLEDLSDLLKDPALIASVEELVDNLSKALGYASAAGEQLVKLTDSSASLLGSVTDAVTSSSSDLNNGVNKVLDGLTSAAGSGPDISSAASQLQDVGGTLQNAIDKVLNQFTEGNNLLNIDASAKRQSFTSEKNPSPSSLQVVLRTESIGLELMKEADTSKEETPQTPWGRIKLVFEKILRAIRSLFE